MADGMVVLRDGKAMQQGPPRDLYRRPATRFVADFLGESNFIDAETLSVEAGVATLRTPAGEMRSTAFDPASPPKAGVTLSIRPEALRIGGDAAGAHRHEGTLRTTRYLGRVARQRVALDGDGGDVKVFQPDPEALPAIGDRVRLSVDPGSVVVLPA